MGDPDRLKNQYWTFFDKSAKLSSGGFSVFSSSTGWLLLEIIERAGFEVLVSMVEWPKHGVPWPRKKSFYPQLLFCLTFSRSRAFETSMQLAAPKLVLYNIAVFGRSKIFTSVFPKHFLQGQWTPNNSAQESRRAGGPAYSWSGGRTLLGTL